MPPLAIDCRRLHPRAMVTERGFVARHERSDMRVSPSRMWLDSWRATDLPGSGEPHHELDRQPSGRAGGSAAYLFSGPGDVSLDQAAGPEDISQFAGEGAGFRRAGRQSGTV